jgi:transposase
VRFVDVARRHRVRAGQLYKWRRLVELGMIGIPGASELPSFIAVEMRDGPGAMVEPAGERLDPVLEPAPCRAAAGFIEIDLGHGRCVRVDTHVDADALARVLSVLDRR